MKKNICIIALLVSFITSQSAFSQIYSFEDNKIPGDWSINKGTLNISAEKYKLGNQSLQINWKQGAILTLQSPSGISEACQNKNGGINVWIYNKFPINEHLIFSFKDTNKKEVCRFPFLLNFKGWRCIWAKFQGDMNMPPKSNIKSVEMQFPQETKEGVIFIDFLA